MHLVLPQAAGAVYIIDRPTYTAVIAGLVFKGEERPKFTVGL